MNVSNLDVSTNYNWMDIAISADAFYTLYAQSSWKFEAQVHETIAMYKKARRKWTAKYVI